MPKWTQANVLSTAQNKYPSHHEHEPSSTMIHHTSTPHTYGPVQRVASLQALPQKQDTLKFFVGSEIWLASSTRTVWPSGLRRWLQAPVRKGVGSNPTAVTLFLSKKENRGVLLLTIWYRKKKLTADSCGVWAYALTDWRLKPAP